jgi:hypothetical protein
LLENIGETISPIFDEVLLEIDFILDRINQVGIENLTLIEKKYLENYKV